MARKQPAIQQLKQHVEALCERYDISIQYHANRQDLGASAEWGTELICIPRVVSHQTYAIAMHEIGHHRGRGQDKGLLSCERGAWTWARNNALVWTPEMQAEMDRCQAWYRANQKSEQKKWKAGRQEYLDQWKGE